MVERSLISYHESSEVKFCTTPDKCQLLNLQVKNSIMQVNVDTMKVIQHSRI